MSGPAADEQHAEVPPDAVTWSAPWSLVQYTAGPADGGGVPGVLGVLAAGVVRRLPPPWPATARDLLEDWDEWTPRLRALDPAALSSVRDARLLAPITFPRKVLGAGANFYDHAREMGTAEPDPSARPFFFLKPPTTAVIGPDERVRIPGLAEAGLDWEVELAVVIGRRARDIAVDQVAGVIAGYAVANDLSARLRFPRPDAVAPPFGFDWLQHKGFDGSCPLGPGIVPGWLVPDPQQLRMRLSVNGTVKQDSSTKDMVIGVGALVAAASSMITLEPGDVILTGTPAGVGMPRQDFLRAGDVVTAEIENIGCVRTTIEEA